MVTEVAIEPQPQVTTTATTKQCAAIRPQLIDTSALLRHLNWVQNQHTNAQVCGVVLLVNILRFFIFIDREAREIMDLVASVRLSVRLSVLSRLNRLTYKSYYQSEVFVCVSVIRGHILITARMRSIGVLII